MDASAQPPCRLDAQDVDDIDISIVHEVRQPLTAILASAAAGLRHLDHAPADLGPAREAFRRILADGTRAGELVEDIGSRFGPARVPTSMA